MNSHDLLITALIVVVVAIQLLVFLSVFRRIKLFKRIFPDAYNFRTLKIYVPKNRIGDITPQEIFTNLSKYTSYVAGEHVVDITQEDEHPIAGPQTHSDESFDVVDETEAWSDGGADEVWMRNGNEEQKVPMHLVQYYEDKGWERIISVNDHDSDLPF